MSNKLLVGSAYGVTGDRIPAFLVGDSQNSAAQSALAGPFGYTTVPSVPFRGFPDTKASNPNVTKETYYMRENTRNKIFGLEVLVPP